MSFTIVGHAWTLSSCMYIHQNTLWMHRAISAYRFTRLGKCPRNEMMKNRRTYKFSDI